MSYLRLALRHSATQTHYSSGVTCGSFRTSITHYLFFIKLLWKWYIFFFLLICLWQDLFWVSLHSSAPFVSLPLLYPDHLSLLPTHSSSIHAYPNSSLTPNLPLLSPLYFTLFSHSCSLRTHILFSLQAFPARSHIHVLLLLSSSHFSAPHNTLKSPLSAVPLPFNSVPALVC